MVLAIHKSSQSSVEGARHIPRRGSPSHCEHVEQWPGFAFALRGRNRERQWGQQSTKGAWCFGQMVITRSIQSSGVYIVASSIRQCSRQAGHQASVFRNTCSGIIVSLRKDKVSE